MTLQLHEKFKLLGSQEPLRIPSTQSAGPITEDLISYAEDRLLEVCNVTWFCASLFLIAIAQAKHAKLHVVFYSLESRPPQLQSEPLCRCV